MDLENGVSPRGSGLLVAVACCLQVATGERRLLPIGLNGITGVKPQQTSWME